MSQFPQNGVGMMPPQQFQGTQGTFAPPQQQGGYVPQQQNFQQPQQQGPQLQKVNLGQGYAPGQFPHKNECHMVGQIFPNQWMPQGIEYKVNPNNQNTGTLNINVKLRNAWGDQPNQVKIQFIRVVCFGGLAQHLANQLRAGMFVEFRGEFRPNKYKSNKTQKITNVNQIILDGRQNGPAPINIIGEGPMYEEIDPTRQQGGWNNNAGGGAPAGGGGGWNGQPQQQQQPMQQQAWGQQQQPAPQAFQQAPPQQQPAQTWPQQQQMPPQQMVPQQPMQQMQPMQAQQPFQQPQQGFVQGQPMSMAGLSAPVQQQGNHPAMGVPQQPQQGQMNGSFAPPTQQQQQPMQQQGTPAGFQAPTQQAPPFL